MLLASLLGACATTRLAAPPKLIDQVSPPGFPRDVRFLSSDRGYLEAHLDRAVRRLSAVAHGSIRILALSGGGAGGAFGAGVLYGLACTRQRTDFQVVTGVSAGALLAPFAFLGPSWYPQMEDAFDTHRTDDLLQRRPWLGFLFHPGIYSRRPLTALVTHFVTPRMIRAVAAQSRHGRVLLVATTDLDKQESVIWNMGLIAQHGGPAARKLFTQVLIASASIPGVFPPVLIRVQGGGKTYDEMHVDGGTTLPFFVASNIADVLPLRLPQLKGAKVYVIVNGQLSTYPKTTPAEPMAVLSRSFSAALMHASRRALVISAVFARHFGMHFRFTYLPMTYPFDGSLDFKYQNMHRLFQYGESCAQAGLIWTTLTQAIDEGQRAAHQMPRLSDDCPGAPGSALH
ncbi:MAG: patatin-like phospholipase family protein [Steroidobacteraceae bacterium]